MFSCYPTACSSSGFMLLGALAVGIMVAVPRSGDAQDRNDGLRQRFLAEAPNRWEEYRRQCQNLQGSYTVLGRFDERVIGHTRVEAKLSDTSWLFVEQSLGEDELGGTAYAVNPKYAFTLRRKTPNDPWILVAFQNRDSNTSGIPRDIERKGAEHRLHLLLMIELFNETLTDALRKSSFHVRSVRPALDNPELVEVAFDYPHDKVEDDGTFNYVQGGTLIVDPAHYWCVRSMNLNLKTRAGTAMRKIRIQLRDPNSRIPIPIRWESDETWALADGKTTHIIMQKDIDLAEPSRLPAVEEFTLTAFGLPEPVGVEWKRPTPRYVWILVGAGICAVLAVGFRYLARHRWRASS